MVAEIWLMIMRRYCFHVLYVSFREKEKRNDFVIGHVEYDLCNYQRHNLLSKVGTLYRITQKR